MRRSLYIDIGSKDSKGMCEYLPSRVSACRISEVELGGARSGESSQHTTDTEGTHTTSLGVALLCLGDEASHIFDGGSILAGQSVALSLQTSLTSSNNKQKIYLLFKETSRYSREGRSVRSQVYGSAQQQK